MSKKFGLVALCLIVTLVGCGEKTMDTVTEPPTDPVHFYEEVREDFLIDAEVIGFPSDNSLTVYEATPRVITEGQILNFLTANGDNITEWEEHDSEYFIGHRGKTALEGRFWAGTDTSGLYPGDVSYQNSMNERWSECHLYYGEQYYNNNESFYFAHLFTEPQDFAFATAQEAEAKVRDMLSILGLNDLILSRTFYIDHEILADEVTPILQTEEWQSRDKRGYIPTFDDWSEADDGYIFEYRLCVDSIPIFAYNTDLGTLLHHGDTIYVWYQASGIISLAANASLWDIGAPAEIAANHISGAEALSIARVRLENTKSYTKTTVYKISAEYFYVLDGSRFLMRPVWVVYANATTANHFTSTQYVIIDAITGDEIF